MSCAFCGVASAPADRASTPPAAAPALATGVATAPKTKRVATQPIEAGQLACPRCAIPLFDGAAHGITLHGCGRCGGIWVDNASAQTAMSTLDQVIVDLAERAGDRAAAEVETRDLVACPACRETLARKRVTRAQVLIDLCEAHGTWFDRYELAQVLDALGAPKRAPTTTSLGPVPDFRAGANPEVRDFVSLALGGAFTLLGALAAADSKR